MPFGVPVAALAPLLVPDAVAEIVYVPSVDVVIVTLLPCWKLIVEVETKAPPFARNVTVPLVKSV